MIIYSMPLRLEDFLEYRIIKSAETSVVISMAIHRPRLFVTPTSSMVNMNIWNNE